MELNFPSSTSQHSSLLGILTKHQRESIKEHLVDIDNRFNKVFTSFALFYSEFSLGFRVIDTFSDHFSFNLFSSQLYISSLRLFLFTISFFSYIFLSLFLHLHVSLPVMYVVMM